MCGICFALVIDGDCTETTGLTTKKDKRKCILCESFLGNRGPDIQNIKECPLVEGLKSVWVGCTLHFRGELTPQPLQDLKGNILLWNGEIFGGLEVGAGDNDGEILLQTLGRAQNDREVLEVLVQIQGPWAAVYWQKSSGRLWFGRDLFGRRSLLWHISPDQSPVLAFSSVAVNGWEGWKELPASGIYILDLRHEDQDKLKESTAEWLHSNLTLYPWLDSQHPQSETNAGGFIDITEEGAISQEETGKEGKTERINRTENRFTREALVVNMNNESEKFRIRNVYVDEAVQASIPNKLGVLGLVSCISNFNDSLPEQGSLEMAPESLLKDAAEFGISDLERLASREQDSLSDQLISVLGEAVRVRVTAQADECGLCLASSVLTKSSKITDKPNHIDSDDFLAKCHLHDNHGCSKHVPLHDNVGISADKAGVTMQAECSPEGSTSHADPGRGADNVGISADKAGVPMQAECSPEGSTSHADPGRGADNVGISADKAGVPMQAECSPEGSTSHADPGRGADNVGISAAKVGVPMQAECSPEGSTSHADPGRGADNSPRCGHARVAVLFSGGIDSLVIAALVDRYVDPSEPIDLLNVAFEQKARPSAGKQKKTDKTGIDRDPFSVPDRITGRQGLKVLNPNRKWNFVEINVTHSELQEARSGHVNELLYPLRTVLDDSIGCAIWFASRGNGRIIRDGERSQPYSSTARVVLVGMGADEQLAGYSRHRVKYNTGGWTGLIEEIKMEIDRISSRNLGRDDRIITDHGKESRFPFLDENVVSFLNLLPVWQKADLSLPRGFGEKYLLRLCAAKLGLGESAMLPKRAIQFGSRIAKMENKKEKASDVCDRL